MDTDLTPDALPPPTAAVQELAPGAVLSLEAPAGLRIAVQHGRVWLTCSGDADDHFLHAGDSLRLARGGRVVLENDGRGAARWTMERATASRPAQPSMSAQIVRAQPQA